MAQDPFSGNVVIITGASRGIGRELAFQLAQQRATLVLAARNGEQLSNVAQLCRKKGAQQVICVPTDVTDEEQCKHLIEETIATYGHIDTLLLNAGEGRPRRFEALTDLTDLKGEMALNYLGVVHCVFYALPYLRQSRGRIVGVNSLSGLIGIPGTTGYNSSKHAARGFFNTLRAELQGSGVTVTVIHAGAISTDRLRETMGEMMDKIPTTTPERCASIIIRAAAARKRQVIMTVPGKLLPWINMLVPSLLDRMLNSIRYQ
jgi:short-subunit dehydrogenase